MSQEDLLTQETHFEFGKNWLDYAEKIDEQKIAQASVDLQRLAGSETLAGKSFLDIGCGSGLHSLAAIRLGASRVVGVDIDPNSIAASKKTFQRFGQGADARFEVASVFDMTPKNFGGFDIVYSWGVLHHTGDMFRALDRAASLVSPEGRLMVALYKETPFCGMWRAIKKNYSRAGARTQRAMMDTYILLTRIPYFILRRDFASHVRNYHLSRGMNYYNDVHDWLGGYPYESISPEACREFFARQGFSLEREFVRIPWLSLPRLLGSGCDEYVFRRSVASSYQ
jgi:2-polyprenyl-6-hydroxyphenyl methylase/3-demethylubiquinone-9 3-methyltransferase